MAAPDRVVAGWKIADRGDGWVRLQASSWFMTNHLEFTGQHHLVGRAIARSRTVSTPIALN